MIDILAQNEVPGCLNKGRHEGAPHCAPCELPGLPAQCSSSPSYQYWVQVLYIHPFIWGNRLGWLPRSKTWDGDSCVSDCGGSTLRRGTHREVGGHSMRQESKWSPDSARSSGPGAWWPAAEWGRMGVSEPSRHSQGMWLCQQRANSLKGQLWDTGS